MDTDKTVLRDGMRISFDVPIEMDDGLVLYADVFAPVDEGRYPVLMTMGPYAKGLAFQEGWKFNWDKLVRDFPEVAEGTSNAYANWETVDPEKWVPDGYVCVRVDSRGAGRSAGVLDPWSPRETRDYYDCIEWAGVQPWSNGKVGLSGISYYAMNQWHVAALQPPHLTAMLVQEGAADFYREFCRHGGILSRFLGGWFQGLIKQVQHGLGDNGPVSRVTGEPVAGPETLTPEELARNRVDPYETAVEHPLLDSFSTDRTADLSKVVTPFLSCGNWGGQGLHPRGNIEGYLGAASTQKWLEMHGDTHSSGFYTDYGVALQKRFFGHFLQGADTGWEKQPPVALRVRHPGEVFVDRGEQEWPLARTRWTKFYLNAADRTLGADFTPGDAVSYRTTGDGVTFLSAPLAEQTEITGPVAAKLFLSSDTTDADVFACLQVFDPDGNEITFQGSNDPRTPIGLGWLRASHRKLDPQRSLPYRPWHTHDEVQPLTPGEPVELDIEIWPTCLVIPPGCRIGLLIRGRDYDNGAEATPGARYPLRGIGPFRHDDERDRPADVFGGTNVLHFADGQESYLLLPVIPR
ncbi:CocE/NonD family hydrolase [Micromonospora sp. WMMD975]|uniref:CocE/NonD family hydrolase n=1 Tax=Micromonospora sp. WMMD975 TaxID=3016087 RepID=UPI00249BAC1E|nr:CocE/NonD family hydrolase [Micromonospora sp. WMMD975]WFE35206.1 CocE/NonD family hydrolase [Micromonospora sp. WMMD975]